MLAKSKWKGLKAHASICDHLDCDSQQNWTRRLSTCYFKEKHWKVYHKDSADISVIVASFGTTQKGKLEEIVNAQMQKLMESKQAVLKMVDSHFARMEAEINSNVDRL